MSEFTPVASIGDVPDPGKTTLDVEDRLVVLIHAGGQWYCLDDVCTHDGGPLGEGPLDGDALTCVRHGAKFNIRSGEAMTMPATEPTAVHQVKVEGDTVFVKLNED